MEKIDNLKIQREKILEGLRQAYQKMLEFKRSKNSPLVVSENGEIRHLSPFEPQENL